MNAEGLLFSLLNFLRVDIHHNVVIVPLKAALETSWNLKLYVEHVVKPPDEKKYYLVG